MSNAMIFFLLANAWLMTAFLSNQEGDKVMCVCFAGLAIGFWLIALAI
jgi:hypothetical protein